MKRVGTWLVVAGLLLVLGVTNYNIWKKEQVLESGHQVMLELRPVDPRSLMQGDYMILRYSADTFPDAETMKSLPRKGTIVISVDASGVGKFARLDDGTPLARDDTRLQYKYLVNTGELRLGAESYFFQEGHADVYANAKYGVLRVDESGASVLVGLADKDRLMIIPPPANP
jgi:uncharacterized membrane-anchored protein